MTLTYSEAESLLATARDPENGKPLRNHTRLYKRGDDYAVRLHDTDVVTIHENGNYTLTSGGWFTVTTKDRINDYSPARVVSRRTKAGSVWTVADPGEMYAWREDNPVRFRDGIVVDGDGRPVRQFAPRLKDVTAGDRKDAKLEAAIKKYVAGYTDATVSELWHYATTEGTAGDCWFCSMFEQAGASDTDHLREHIREGYRMASLIMNAIRAKGYQHPEVIFQMGAEMRSERDAQRIRELITQYLRKKLITSRPIR